MTYEMMMAMYEDMEYQEELSQKRIYLEELETELEKLMDEWTEKLGHYMHRDADGYEWFDEMTPEDEALDRDMLSKIESLEIEIKDLREELEVK